MTAVLLTDAVVDLGDIILERSAGLGKDAEKVEELNATTFDIDDVHSRIESMCTCTISAITSGWRSG